MSKQYDLFSDVKPMEATSFDYGKGEYKNEETETEEIKDPYFDSLMANLELLTQQTQASNDLLRSMIDDLQKDWTEEEKLQINDPKEYKRQQKLKEQTETKEIMAKELTVEAIETLKKCKVEGMVIKLPEGDLDRKIYLEVKAKLELIGGKWKGNKVQGFVFNEDPTELLAQIANGEKRNLKKEFQFFATPEALCDELVELAELTQYHTILEPSAGQGAIIKAIHKAAPNVVVDCCEAMEVNQTFLKKLPNANILCADFLGLRSISSLKYDRIIANPPFSKNQDIDHVREMFYHLAPKGRLVSITSKHWQMPTNKKEVEFKSWLSDIGAQVIEVETGEFKESGTNIATVIIVIDKK